MVDVDRRPTGPNPAHLAGLRRLSARAASVSAPTVRNGLLSFSALSEKVITHLRNSGHAEFARSDSHSDPVLKSRDPSPRNTPPPNAPSPLSPAAVSTPPSTATGEPRRSGWRATWGSWDPF
ncbi:hypothetical protein ACSQ67_007598 [Phaseolus vulgaris]